MSPVAELQKGKVIAPDEAPEEEETAVNGIPVSHWEALNPCRVCGKNQNEGPERDAHVFGHCWKCGYRPGQTVPAGVPMAATGLTDSQVAKITQELRKGLVEDILAALRSGVDPSQIQAEYVPAAGGAKQIIGDQGAGD